MSPLLGHNTPEPSTCPACGKNLEESREMLANHLRKCKESDRLAPPERVTERGGERR